MAKTYTNPFDMFGGNEVKRAVIEALGGAEISYRELSMLESDGFSKRLVKSYGEDGRTPELDFDAATEIKYEKASLVLVDPKMTVEQLKALSAHAVGAINEINALVDPEVDEEGNALAPKITSPSK